MNTRGKTTFIVIASLIVGIVASFAGSGGLGGSPGVAHASAAAVGAGSADDGNDQLAAAGDGDIHKLTLVAAVQRALLRASSLTLAQFDIEEASVALQEAELGQLIGNPRKELEQAERDVQEKEDAYADELVNVALQVEEAYQKVLSTGEALTIQHGNYDQAERQFALTEARFEAGLIARQDYLEAELSFEQSVHATEAAERQHADARRALNRLIGLDEDAVVDLQDEFPFEPWHIDLDEAVAEALANRSEIVRAERGVEQARAQVEQADTPYAAPVELRRAEIGLQRADIQLEQTKEQIAAEVRSEWHELADLLRGVDTAARREELALGKVQISRTRYEAGTIALLELLRDEEAYATGRQDAVTAIWNYNAGKALFLRTLGRTELPPLPDAIAEYMESWHRE